jgi:molybdenum cofactor guanylyltransferase
MEGSSASKASDFGRVVGVLLAGGMSRRMGGGDKCLRLLGGRTILERVMERVRPQVSDLIISANGDEKRFGLQNVCVVADVIEGSAGPLAGVLSAMEWAKENVPEASFIVSFATDAPFLPQNLVARLGDAVRQQGADMAFASSDGRNHPVFALWPVKLAPDLRKAMEKEGMRKVNLWTERYKNVPVDFEKDPVDPFFNINREEDLSAAESLLGSVDA